MFKKRVGFLTDFNKHYKYLRKSSEYKYEEEVKQSKSESRNL